MGRTSLGGGFRPQVLVASLGILNSQGYFHKPAMSPKLGFKVLLESFTKGSKLNGNKLGKFKTQRERSTELARLVLRKYLLCNSPMFRTEREPTRATSHRFQLPPCPARALGRSTWSTWGMAASQTLHRRCSWPSRPPGGRRRKLRARPFDGQAPCP